ncbi:STAS-like domain-containing protein, partial [Verrucomicrobiota bacterium]
MVTYNNQAGTPTIFINGGWSIKQLSQAIGAAENEVEEHKRLVIEFGDDAFLKMDVVAFLCSWCLHLQQQGVAVEVTGTGDAVLYLARMNFNRLLHLSEPTMHRNPADGRFIPIRLVANDDDVKTAVDAVCELAIHQFEGAVAFVPAMEWAVNEIVDNIRIHSQSTTPGVVCAQYYPQQHRLDVAICDMGIGLKASLDGAHAEYNLLDHTDAITHATTRGVTRDSNVGQGNGMAGTLEIAKQNGGEFHIWTGDSLFNLKAGESSFDQIPYLQGTGILFSLDTNRSVDLSQTWIGEATFTYIDAMAEEATEKGGLNIAQKCASTGSRPPAKALGRIIRSILPELDSPLVLDFSDVKSASSSFLDELLGRLIKELGEDTFNAKIQLQGMNDITRKMANVVIGQRLHPESIRPPQKASETIVPNAWLVRLGEEVSLDGYILTNHGGSSLLQGIQFGDALLISEERDGTLNVIGVGRLFRKRYSLDAACFYLDGYLPALSVVALEELNIPVPENKASVNRLDWSLFEMALTTTTGVSWASFPVIAGDSPHEQAYVRELMQLAMTDDLLGPADGPMEEIIGMGVRDRYLVGKLAPQDTVITEEDELSGAGASDDQESSREVDASTNQSLVPSSLGFTFCVDSSVEAVELAANWGRYERTESERINDKTEKPFRCWKRIPSGGVAILSMDKRKIEPFAIDEHCPAVLIQGSISAPLESGDRLVTLFFINNQTVPEQSQDQAWVFQPELIVRDPDRRAIFRRRPVLDSNGTDSEREALEMIYRKQVEFAVGHGISVHATTPENDTEHAIEIRTSILPEYEVPVTETPGLANEDRPGMKRMITEGFLDMENLAELDTDALSAGLKILTEDYALWIKEQRGRIGKDVLGYDTAASLAMDRCSHVLQRLEEGIETLISNEHALESFRFANRAMALQRIRSIYALSKRRGEEPDLDALNIRKNRSWRPFQLAFVLLSLPALADPKHKDRTEPLEAYADLLWFPTGGGKTEAYLGVAAFTMAIRRLQGELGGLDGSRGLAVIMRYTLRLLTLQQFQRATTLICALESMRREDPSKWGDTPFTIGLWVGNRVTPGTTEDAHLAIQSFRDGKRHGSNSPAQLTTCPWCGAEIAEGRDIEVKKDIGRTFIYCGDKFGRCDFGRSKSKDLGIPVLVVDEEIYRHPPTMLIATVDKFAMMAWRGQVRTLFGRATQECERHGLLWPDAECTGNHHAKNPLPRVSVKEITPIRPPDLIIQDEFHLISGPLGTMVGLYETAVDELSTWQIGDKSIRPKVIASTATVRKADEQVNNVFLRQVTVFPPHGLDVEDNFFSVQRP